MIREAWAAYARRSWGHGELDYRRGSYGLFGRNSGYTIVTSMSTLWAAGLKEEFEAGRKWITRSLSSSFASISSSVEVSRVVSGYIGGLLSCYALTKEVLFLERAVEIGLLLEPAYAGTKGGLPHKYIVPKDGSVSGTRVPTSAVAAGLLEYAYLAEVSGDERFSERFTAIKANLKELRKSSANGLLLKEVDIMRGRWSGSAANASLFGSTFSAYRGLLAVFIACDGFSGMPTQEDDCFQEYLQAIEAAVQRAEMLCSISLRGDENYFTFARDYHPTSKRRRPHGRFMDVSGHALAGMFALGARALERRRARRSCKRYANTEERERIGRHWFWAKSLAETGRALAETYFLLYRLTRDARYREYAWALVQALRRSCRNQGESSAGVQTVGSFGTVVDVTQTVARRTTYQPAELLSSTLKWLLLIFAPDEGEELFSLERWVFTSPGGQPLPIYYRKGGGR
ncbi:hypothetical protein TYRP_015448 [Tyrophagus putrescentiae]|nr:hypothetical protein TYRP_015448 [Tyrophagus putrescentiae]